MAEEISAELPTKIPTPLEKGKDVEGTVLFDTYSKHAKKVENMDFIAKLPEAVKQKIRALKKLQLETTDLEAKFHRKVYDLEKEFESAHCHIFNKRKSIINGDYEPTEDECNFIEAQLISAEKITPTENEIVSTTNYAGIPEFWLLTFKAAFDTLVKPDDEPALKFLQDVRVVSYPEPDLYFVLEFHFSPNEYFTNAVLTKTYYLRCTPDPEDPFSFDGPEIFKTLGCKINWKEGKDLTNSATKPGGEKKLISTTYKVTSFFCFFDPPDLPADQTHEYFDQINTILEHDFEIGHYIKERVIPRAVLYYTGETEDINDNSSDDYPTEDDDDEDEEREH